jgi:hypothetical protein
MPIRIPTSFLWKANINITKLRGEAELIPEDPRRMFLQWSRLPPIVGIDPPLFEIYQRMWGGDLVIIDDLRRSLTQAGTGCTPSDHS